MYFVTRLNTFRSLGTLILEWPQCAGNIRGSWCLVDVDTDVQGGLGDVYLEGVRKAGIEGIDLGILSQEVGGDDVSVG